MQPLARWASLTALVALFVLVVAWAFLDRRGDSATGWPAMALLGLPLLIPLPGMLRGRAGAYLLAAFVSLLYLFHGLVTLVTAPAARGPGSLEAALSLVLVVAASLQARWARGPL
jgi:uncharacterized membrane protein